MGRRRVLRATAAIATLALAPRAWGHEYFVPHIRISHPWCRATAPGAVAATVCMTFDEVTRTDRLIRIESPVAEGAEMGGSRSGEPIDFEVPEGRDTNLSEIGTTVRLIGLRQPLLLGRSYPLLLAFELGGEVNATLDVAYE